MAVRIRLKRMGKIRTPFYRIVVCDSRTKRDGRVIEEIGTYNPKAEPSLIHVDSERAQHWLGVGAQPSTPVAAILKLTGDLQKSKGEEATSTLKVAEARPDKTEVFNEALKESHAEPKTEAVTKKAPKAEKQPAGKDDAAKDDAGKGDAAKDDAKDDAAKQDDSAGSAAQDKPEDKPAGPAAGAERGEDAEKAAEQSPESGA